MRDTDTIIEQFTRLQAIVIAGLEEAAQDLRGRIGTTTFIINLCALGSFLLVASTGLISLVPEFSRILIGWANSQSQPTGRDLILGLRPAIVLVSAVLWLVLLGVPTVKLGVRSSILHYRVSLILLVLVGYPIWFAGTAYLLQLASRPFSPIASLVEGYILLTVLLILLSVFLTCIALVFSNVDLMSPTTLLLVLTVGSRDKIAHKVLQKVKSDDPGAVPTDRCGLLALVEHRTDDINLQVQIASFILGALGLVGLLALFVPEESIQTMFSSIASYLANNFSVLSDNSTMSAGSLTGFAGVLILALVGMAVWYFTQSYKMARALEIIRILLLPSAPIEDKDQEAHATGANNATGTLTSGFLISLLVLAAYHLLVRPWRRGKP